MYELGMFPASNRGPVINTVISVNVSLALKKDVFCFFFRFAMQITILGDSCEEQVLENVCTIL